MEAVIILMVVFVVFSIRAIYIIKKRKREGVQSGGCLLIF